MHMSRIQWLQGLTLAVCLSLLSSITTMCKTPVLKNTQWTGVQELFVADAGTMTITYTLDFVSDKDVRIKEVNYMPSYPATYMNADGTVDTFPARTTERSETGTYLLRRGKLTIKTEDGLQTEYSLRADGTMTREEPYGETTVFSQIKPDLPTNKD